jgi:hypothetical protein
MSGPSDKSDANQSAESDKKKSADQKREASWPSVLFFIHLNILGLYGIVILFTHTKLITIALSKISVVARLVSQSNHQKFRFPAFILTAMGIYGTTVGAHRLWTHQSFKANTFLRFMLMICQTMAGQVRRKSPVMRMQRFQTLNFDAVNLIIAASIYSFPATDRGQFTTSRGSIGSITRHSRHPMIRSTATRTSCMLRSSRISES